MRTLQWAAVLLGTMLLANLAGIVYLAPRVKPLEPLPAEGYRNRANPEPLNPWHVGVLGDSQKGLANLRNIVLRVAREGARLLIHTGDLVSDNDEGHYRLAYRYLDDALTDCAAELPHVTPGNHDLKGGTDRFRKWCGELEESFVKRDIAFVLINNAHGIPPDPKHVETRIAAAGPHKAVVLAMHQPPFDVQGSPRPEYAGFLSWLEKSKVAYLFCGHVHAYLRKKVGETTVIVNGVGGDSDSWQLNQKVYATILDIDGTRISDRTVEIEPVHEVVENVVHLALGHVWEAYRSHPLLCWGATLLLAAGVGWGWVRLLKKKAVA